SFKDRVFYVVKKISAGSVLTYKEVARRAGKPKAARAVGAILRTNFNPKIPCHRVIYSNGRLGGYNRGVKKKFEILKQEGVL
ncbi:MAG: MGMT family protein, partial [bacterium]|nr:MGMT family protein [bacterium]